MDQIFTGELSVVNSAELLRQGIIEVINDKRWNTIIECIYKHPKTIVSEFTIDFMLPRLDNLSPEKIEKVLMVDFNINLLHSDVNKDILNFMVNIHWNNEIK